MNTRRTLLTGGGGVLAVAAGGLAARAWQTGLIGDSGEARRLWQQWFALPPPMSVVAAGVLAASPHNSQPWQFQINDESIDLEIDPRRDLGPVDPYRRQMWIGAGCAIENMVSAGEGLGRAVRVTAAPDPGHDTLAARLEIGLPANPPRPALMTAISNRHTNRGRYHRDRALERSLLDELTSKSRDPDVRVDLFARGEPRGRRFEAGIIEATRSLIAQPEFMRASDAWFRNTPREESHHRDGPSLRCSGAPAWKRALGMLAPRASDEVSHRSWLGMTIDQQCGTAPAFGAISLRQPSDRRQLLEGGRLWQRLMLEGATRGLAFQPLDQLLELDDREHHLGRPRSVQPLLAGLTEAGWFPVMTFRLGWPQASAPASSRRALDTFVSAMA